jgi:glycosyltransferase involved in cell wall biosynthesis
MGSAVPVVATAVNGVPGLVQNGTTGLLVPPGEAVALANALRTLLSDPFLAAQFAVAGRARAETHFSVKRVVSQVQAIYDELLAR